ncbi:hypothetical protein HYW59_03340 [Candidatus Kaiserbacteria bacterium]|nr:hypothetical protein [Candidatus Kaiserbacteria bacterium]
MAHRRSKKSEPLSEETIQALIQLGAVLRPVVNRLVTEGKAKVVNGKMIFLTKNAND